MSLPFTEEQEMFRKSVRDFVDREVKPHVVTWEEAGAVPRELFLRMGSLGFLGVRLSEEYGGSGLDFWHTVVLVQELMRSGAVGIPVSVLAHAEFATKIIDRAGTPEQKSASPSPTRAAMWAPSGRAQSKMVSTTW